MPARERLSWYAERFEAVELNSSFYAVPDRNNVERWLDATPGEFVFDVKLHRLLSRHSAGLDSLPPELREGAEVGRRGRVALTRELEAALADRLIEELTPMVRAGRLGALLLQLTPSFSPSRHELRELEGLLERLRPQRVAVELRHRGWVSEERLEQTLDWFSDHDAAFVGVDAPAGDHVPIMPGLDAVTRPDLAYVRLHGRNTEGYLNGKSVAERFGWIYSDEELEQVAGRARSLAEEAEQVHVMFNNNRDDDAPSAARRLRELLGQDPGPPSGRDPGSEGTGQLELG